jgi:hypothetical protein
LPEEKKRDYAKNINSKSLFEAARKSQAKRAKADASDHAAKPELGERLTQVARGERLDRGFRGAASGKGFRRKLSGILLKSAPIPGSQIQ